MFEELGSQACANEAWNVKTLPWLGSLATVSVPGLRCRVRVIFFACFARYRVHVFVRTFTAGEWSASGVRVSGGKASW